MTTAPQVVNTLVVAKKRTLATPRGIFQKWQFHPLANFLPKDSLTLAFSKSYPYLFKRKVMYSTAQSYMLNNTIDSIL